MNIQAFANDYTEFVKNNLIIKKINEYHELYELLPPFFNQNGDSVSIYIQEDKKEKKYFLTDDCQTINNLEMSGIELTEDKISLIRSICIKDGVRFVDKEIQVLASEEDLIAKTHSLIQVILRVDSLIFLEKSE